MTIQADILICHGKVYAFDYSVSAMRVELQGEIYYVPYDHPLPAMNTPLCITVTLADGRKALVEDALGSLLAATLYLDGKLQEEKIPLNPHEEIDEN